MSLLQILILALVQGITEFLPISSSGHLVLIHGIFNQDGTASWDQDLMLDVAVHIGTLLSVLVYFRKDVWEMFKGLLQLAKRDTKSHGARLNIYVIVGSIPVILAGLALHEWEPTWLRTVEIMAWMTIIFGIVLWWVDETRPMEKTIDQLNIKSALFVGFAQVLALVPGTSRSGITMIAARYLGFNRQESAHFSLLLAIVAIAGAGFITSLDLIKSGNPELGLDVLIAVFLSFISGWAAISLMMKWLEKSSFRIFAIYRILLGAALLFFLYSGTLA